ncbi:MAG: PQQ-binding-like beta-propeller repeat protein [Bryobacteraceae bacterium]
MKIPVLGFGVLTLVGGLFLVNASDPIGTSGDWPMWGGTPDRNLVSSMKGIPTTWDVSEKNRKNVKWVAQLGSQSYGNPIVAGGQVYVGTNNELVRNPKEGGDRGVLMCFRESDGQFLWQHTSAKLSTGRANDWPFQGVCSSPLVEGDNVYFVTNRCELVSLSAKGDGKGGAKENWKLDMMEEVGASPHNMSNSSPVSYGNLIYVSTSNGQDESHVHVPSPKAPSMIAVDKKTGKVVWEVNNVGDRILHGQWSSPAVGKIGDIVQVVIGEGDGWVRGYEAETGKNLWAFDLNPKDSVWPKTRNEVIATPVIYKNRVYIANGQDPEHGEGVGHLYAIDATKRGDITTSGRIWHFDKIRRSVSTGAIYNGLLFYSDFSGFLHCLDAETGQSYWTHDMLAAVWGSAMVINGKVYLGDEDGDIVVLEASKTKKLISEQNMGSSVYSTPVPANGALFIMNRNQLFALAEK